jgi:hypothetical protein
MAPFTRPASSSSRATLPACRGRCPANEHVGDNDRRVRVLDLSIAVRQRVDDGDGTLTVGLNFRGVNVRIGAGPRGERRDGGLDGANVRLRQGVASWCAVTEDVERVGRQAPVEEWVIDRVGVVAQTAIAGGVAAVIAVLPAVDQPLDAVDEIVEL